MGGLRWIRYGGSPVLRLPTWQRSKSARPGTGCTSPGSMPMCGYRHCGCKSRGDGPAQTPARRASLDLSAEGSPLIEDCRFVLPLTHEDIEPRWTGYQIKCTRPQVFQAKSMIEQPVR